jgi:tetratricopeptide (TPR) repeat protein
MNLNRLKDFLGDPGTRIGKYEIVRKVGEGGMGVVYEAFDPDLKRAVALKVLKQKDADRLRREAAAAAKLRHPNIVTIHEVGPDFIAMEFVAGKSPERPDRRVLATVARAVAYAHSQGVVHRDLKPGNILVDADGRVVLTDFGLSTEQSGGTPGYRAPEGVTGPAADVHALCVMAGIPAASSALEVAGRLERRPRWPIAVAVVAVAAAVFFWPRARDPLRDWSVQEEALTRALKQSPDRVDLLLRRAELRRARTDYSRNRGLNPLPDYAGAEEDLTRALRIEDTPQLRLARGALRNQRAVYKVKYGIDPLADCAGAEEDLIRAGDPGRSWLGNVRFHRGVWRLTTGGDPTADFDAAEKDFTAMGGNDGLMRRGRLRGYQKRFEEAEQDFAKALSQPPGSVWGWTWRGKARLSAGDFDGAEAHLSRAIEVNREFSEAWEQRGLARKAKGDLAGAAEDLREAIRLDPSLEPLLRSKLQECLK